MKKVAIAIASLFTAMVPAAFAQTYYEPYDRGYAEREYRDRDLRDGRRDFARVIESRPLYDSSTAKTECINTRTGYYEEVREENRHRIGKGAAIGALAGGVLGHQVDQGGGTAAGAVIGGLLGHHLEGRRDRGDQADLDMTRCRTFGDSGAPVGYEVRYVYRGQEHVTRMDRDPGRRLRVGEDIQWDGTPKLSQHYDPPGYSGG